jgi:two-component system sensor histidine kinase CpxA
MRRLFFKVFVWFWLTVILVGAVLAGTVLYATQSYQAERRAMTSTLVPQAANDAAETFERAGLSGLQTYLKGVVGRSLSARYPIQGFVFRSGGHAITGLGSPGQLRDLAITGLRAEREDGLYVSGDFAGQQVAGPSGQTYTLVLLFDQQSPAAGSWKMFVTFETPAIILLASGLFCYLITRHVTNPLFRLRSAAAGIAEGRLDTRVGPQLGGRRDEIAELGRDFDLMAERIESLVTGHKRLLGDVSHELRSPLSRLVVALGLVKQGSREEIPEHLERIAVEARRLDKLIGQLLTLSRIDSGVHTREGSSFDLTNLVHEVVSDADFEARSRVRRVVVTSADECIVTGSEELLRSAVENVVRNAVRFTREDTSVEVSLHRQESKAILRVRDHGAGVPEDMLTEIFLPFRRVQSAVETTNDGAGLGLAITERAVNLHSGRVRAVNAGDGGLIVEIELPLATRPS